MFFLRSSKKRARLEDDELIARYRETEDAAYVGELFERYALQIYGICRKYLKEEEECKDASMEVFEYLLKELKKYEIQNFKGWLARATRNFCLMRIRKRVTKEKREEEFKKNEAPVMESSFEEHLFTEDPKEQDLRHLAEAMKSLKDEQRHCVELFYLKQKSYQEVAELTGYSYKQVKSYIQNGKRNLKNEMLSRKNE